MEFKYFVIILSVVSILFLYFLSTLSQPIEIELSEISNFEGKEVIVKGTVTNHRITTYGSQIIEIKDILQDNTSEVIVFVGGETLVEYGDEIQATGKVQKYEDEWEVVVDDKRYVKILQKWNNITTPLWQLAENPSKYLDLNINTSGIIERDYESYFYLTDSEGQYSVVVYYDPSLFFNISEGDKITVGARFVYDSATLRYVLMTNQETNSLILLEKRI